MAQDKSKIEINLDFSQAINEAKKLASTIGNIKEEANDTHFPDEKVSAEVKRANEVINKFAETTKKLGESFEAVTSQIVSELNKVEQKGKKVDSSVDFKKIGEALDELANKLEKVIDTKFKNLTASMKTLANDTRKEITRLNNQEISLKTNQLKAELNQIRTKIKEIKQQDIKIDTSQSDTALQKLSEKFSKLYSELQKTEDKTFQVNDKRAIEQLTNLIRLVDSFKKKVEELSDKTLKVNITNAGFDDMISGMNTLLKTLKFTGLEILNKTSKATDSAKKLNSEYVKSDSLLRRIAKHIANWVLNTGKTKDNVQKTVEHTKKWGSVLLKGFYSMRGVASMFQEIQGFAYNIGQHIVNWGRTAINYVLPAFKEVFSSGLEMASKLETAKIGYKLFFPNDNPDELNQQIKQRAIKSSAFDSGDMAKYASQFAVLAKGDSTLALDAIEGIADLLMASGQDVSTYLDKVVTNTIQVVSYGKATARDWREFTQKIPMFEQILKKIQPELAERLKDENAEINKEDTKHLLEAFQIIHTNSPISGVSEEYARTYAGLKQMTQESFAASMDNVIEKSGFFDLMKQWLTQSDKFSKLFESVFTPLFSEMTSFLSKLDYDTVEGIMNDFVIMIKETVRSVLGIFDLDANSFTPEKIRETMKKIFDAIRNFIVGFAQGIKNVVDFFKDILSKFGIKEDQIASVLGMLTSPWGNMMNKFLNGLAGAAQLVANIADALKGTSIAKLFGKIGGTLFNGLINPKTTFKGMFSRFGGGGSNSNPLSGLPLGSLLNSSGGGKSNKLSKTLGKGIGDFVNGAFNGVEFKSSFQQTLKANGIMKYLGGFLGNTFRGLIGGMAIYSAGQGISDLTYNMTGDENAAANVSVGGGILGGAFAGASALAVTGNPLAMIAGAVGGGVIGGILSSNKAQEEKLKRISEESAEINKKVGELKQDKFDEHANGLLSSVQEQINQQLKKNGMGEIDWGSEKGQFATAKVKAYMEKYDPADWNLKDMMWEGYNSYLYADLQRKLNDFTETKEFRSIGGTTFDPNVNTALRDKLASVIYYAQLNGSIDQYDYGGKPGDAEFKREKIVNDYLTGNGSYENITMTEEQVQAIIDEYNNSVDSNTQLVNKFDETIAWANQKWSEMSNDLKNSLGNYTTQMGEYTKAIIDAVAEAGGHVDENGKIVDENGSDSFYTWVNGVKFKLGKTDADNLGFEVQDKTAELKHKDIQNPIDQTNVANAREEWFKNHLDQYSESDIEWILEEIRKKLRQRGGLSDDFINNLSREELLNYLDVTLFRQTGGRVKKMPVAKPVYRAHGGPLGVDTVPVMAQRGEFIIRKSVVDNVGLPALTALNLGDTKLASRLMGRPNNNIDSSYNRNWQTNNSDNRKAVNNFVKIVNKNTPSRLNSGYSLANRLALGI